MADGTPSRTGAKAASGVVGLVLALIAIAFVARTLLRDREEIADALEQARPGWLLAAFLVAVVGMVAIALPWRRALRLLGGDLPLGQLRIPHFPVPDGHTVESWLRAECQAGLERRYGTVTPVLQERLDYELGVIIQMGYAAYFLIVADFIAFARREGIQTTCRGSSPLACAVMMYSCDSCSSMKLRVMRLI